MKNKHWGMLVGLIILCEALGSLGTLATSKEINTWYALLAKSSFNPPNWLFGPAWGILFALMGIALYVVWQQKKSAKRTQALWLFWVQFVFNIAWSFIFFGQHAVLAGLYEIIVMWVAIVLTIVAFARVSKSAAWVMLPYLAWVTFATILNYSVWVLNK